MKISAVIVGRNEENNLHDCLRSLSWVDERIYVDNGSLDESVEIATKNNAKVFNYSGGDFSKRKNFAFSKAKGDWILSVDADERVTNELKNEIYALVNENRKQFSAYAIPRKNVILGKVLTHGWWPDYVVRLFLRKDFIAWENALHEQPKIKGELGYLKNPLVHLKHDNFEEMVVKTNEWSLVEAKLMYEANHPPMNIARFLTAIFREFWLRFVKDKAFLDGTEGVIYAIYQIYSRFLSYAKLWEMQNNVSKKKK